MVSGGVVIVAYIAAAMLLHLPGAPRVLYDGLAPPAAYRYLDPPDDLADDNEPPAVGSGKIVVTKAGSSPQTISTGDGQLQVVFPKDAFEARKAELTIQIDIVPLVPPQPHELGDGSIIDGNAYQVRARYAKSKDAAELVDAMTVVIRYPVYGSTVVRRDGDDWRKVVTQLSEASLQLFASSDNLGTFAAAGRPHRGRTWLPYAAGAAGVVFGVGGYLWGRRSGRRKKRRKRKSQPRRRKP